MNRLFAKYRQYLIANQSGMILEASDSFCNFTGYHAEELVGQTIRSVFINLLHVDPNFDENHHAADSHAADRYLFTKSLQVRQFHFEKSSSNTSNRQLFQLYEIPNSRFENKNLFAEQLLAENFLGVGVYTPQFMLIKANQTYLSHLTEPFQSKETAYGRYRRDLFPQSDLEADIWNSVIIEKRSACIREQHTSKSGKIKVLNNTLTPVIDNGQVTFLVSVLQDATVQVLEHEILKEQKDQYKAILDNMSDAVISFDRECDYIHMNKTARDLRIKYDINLRSETYYNVDGTPIPRSELPSRKIVRGEDVKNQRFMILKNNQKIYFACSGNTVRDNNGTLKFGIVNIRDVTQVVENENKIRRQKEELDALLNHMMECIIITDAQGHILKINTSALNMLELDPFSNRPYFEELYENFELSDTNGNILTTEQLPLARVIGGESINNVELWLHYRDIPKEPRLCSFSGTQIRQDDGEVIFSIITFKDITEHRLTQEKLIHTIKEKNQLLSEAMAFKDEFLYLITHEMKTPLAVISSALQTMHIVCGKLPGKAEKYMKTISQNTNRQLRLVNTLLEITRIDSGKIKIKNQLIDIVLLAGCIVSSVQPIAQQKNVKIHFHSGMQSKNIVIDEEKVEMILMNLISNALKFTPRNKNIYVELFTEKSQNQSFVCISVRDEGIGIPADKQSIIFERFGQVNTAQSRPSEGTGIGLYLVKRLLDSMNGAIALVSKEGEGSRFTIMLPDVKPVKDAIPVKKQSDSASEDSRLIKELEIQFSDIYF